MWQTWVQSLGWEDPLEKEMSTHSSILAWRIPWTEELGGLQSMGSQRVGHDWVTSVSWQTLNLLSHDCLAHSPSAVGTRDFHIHTNLTQTLGHSPRRQLTKNFLGSSWSEFDFDSFVFGRWDLGKPMSVALSSLITPPNSLGLSQFPLSLSFLREAEVSLPHLVGPCWSPPAPCLVLAGPLPPSSESWALFPCIASLARL